MLREWHLAPGYSEQGDRREGCEMLMVTFAVTFPRDFFKKGLKPQRWKRWRNISSFPINQNCDCGGTQCGGTHSSCSLGLEEEEEEEEDWWLRCCVPWSWGFEPCNGTAAKVFDTPPPHQKLCPPLQQLPSSMNNERIQTGIPYKFTLRECFISAKLLIIMCKCVWETITMHF